MNTRLAKMFLGCGCGAAALLSGCETYPQHPNTESAKPLDAYVESSPHAAPDVTRNVDGQRIANARAEPQNWLTYYGAYDGQRFSQLDRITVRNVKNLRPVWVFQAGVIGLDAAPATHALEAAPIVVDGVMFVSGWDGYVWAIDAATGAQLWRFRYAVPLDTPLCCGNINRGVAVARGKVFVVTLNGKLLALDASSGKLAWETAFADPRAGESATAAPLIVKDMVIVGSSGGEYGVRGHLDAFALEDGRLRWRHYTVPRPGEQGASSGSGDSWQRGGGTTWITGTYDAATDTLFWGTGNPSPPFDGNVRAETNLYTSSVIALDPATGALRWHYQWTPHDIWDFDGINENILFEQDGRHLLGHFDKNGYFYVLDRTNGQFVHATAFVKPDWGIVDAHSGAVTVQRQPTREGTRICPGPSGAKEWTHASYSPQTQLFYVPVIVTCGEYKIIEQPFREGMAYWGGEARVLDEPQYGYLKAIDPRSGAEAWAWRAEQPLVASVLSTAGGLVFAGEPNGSFDAFDAHTGEKLWAFQTGSGIHGNPISYAIGGKQYIAVPSGWGGWLEGFSPKMYGANRGSAIVVFALPD